MQITKEQYERAYRLAREVEGGSTSLLNAMNTLEGAGVNRNSGRDLMSAVRHMLVGKAYKRAVSIATTNDFLTWIRRDYGDSAHQVAIVAVEAHIDYYTIQSGSGMPGYLEVVQKHRAQLDLEANSVAADIEDVITNKDIDRTTQEALVNARIGQGKFRTAVLELWDHRCAVTGATTLAAIRASHIKPWRESDNRERLYPKNGLPLVATLDALFDVGLITFDPNGRLVASPRLPEEDRATLLGKDLRLRAAPSRYTQAYLAHHRTEIYKA